MMKMKSLEHVHKKKDTSNTWIDTTIVNETVPNFIHNATIHLLNAI